MNEDFLLRKLQERRDQNAYRQLRLPDGKTDFYSNDYLGIVTGRLLPPAAGASGSTGSRLLAGNYQLIEETEQELAAFHQAEAALIFNSGYDANTGLLSCVPRRGDTILYDSLSHASIRDGIRLSFARAFSFEHNDIDDLEKKLKAAAGGGQLFVVTESVFSMDGDQAPLQAIAAHCAQYGAGLIVDEAHATGVVGERGEGLVQQLGLQQACFARIHTFGKAVGCHGAVIAGSERLRNYLVNFSRPFIFSTALPETAVHAIRESYRLFPGLTAARQRLAQLTAQWQQARLPWEVLVSSTPIQGIIVPGNEAVKKLAAALQENKLDVRPILYPTVPRGKERLRIILHAFNTPQQLAQLIQLLGGN